MFEHRQERLAHQQEKEPDEIDSQGQRDKNNKPGKELPLQFAEHKVDDSLIFLESISIIFSWTSSTASEAGRSSGGRRTWVQGTGGFQQAGSVTKNNPNVRTRLATA